MYKPILNNSDEITDFIIEFACSPIDEELIREYFRGCIAILKSIDISYLQEGDESQNIRCIKKEMRYERLPIETMPPLIVENGIVTDGNHRLRVARKNGVKKIAVYDIVPTTT